MSSQEVVTTNGVTDELFDMDDPDYQKMKMRPADIDADMREMERRKRVELMMSSRTFKEELEKIVEKQIKEGYSPSSLMVLQQLYENAGYPSRLGSGVLRGGSGCVIPIADIRGVDSMAYAKGEKILRCKLAACYRLVDIFNWSESIYNHISVRISQDQEHFLINPFGLMYYEVTASSLVKVDMQGNVVEPGTSNFGVNVAGFTLHSAIHAARPDIKCVIHVHVPCVTAVASSKQGLLPLTQESLILGEISYHDYEGIFVDPSEKETLARDLGPVNKVMLLRNHGCVCCGESIEEAFFLLYTLVHACESQMKMITLGIDNLVLVSNEAKVKAYETARKGGGGVNSLQEGGADGQGEKKEGRKWKVGELEFEGFMRMLDNAGFRTGYMYKHPLTKSELPKPKSDVEIPPAASSYSYVFDEDDLFKYSPMKKILECRKSQDKTRWLNSPNVYQKVEVLETGTQDPKKITKWVADGTPTHSTAVKIESSLQFVPKNTDPKEFRQKQKQIKENRRAGEISAGPQSQVLDGISWEEAKKLQDASMSGTNDQVILVGAASKGIIQREFRHNAMVYKSPYAKNPFDQVTEQDIEDYKLLIEKKQKGDFVDGEDQPSLTETVVVTSMDQSMSAIIVDTTVSPAVSPTSLLSEEEGDRSITVNGNDSECKPLPRCEDLSSHEDSPSKEHSLSESSKKEKKKKKGLRTPSFLKKKSKDKKKTEAS